MKTRTSYAWESEDPSLEFVEHAFNRLRNFIEVEKPEDFELMRPYRRAVLSGSDFSAADVAGVAKMLMTMADRVTEKVGRTLYNDGPDASLQVEALKAAATNARNAAVQFVEIFSQALPNPAADLAEAWTAMEEKGGE